MRSYLKQRNSNKKKTAKKGEARLMPTLFFFFFFWCTFRRKAHSFLPFSPHKVFFKRCDPCIIKDSFFIKTREVHFSYFG